MVRRLFWVAVGAGAAIFVYVKVREQLQKATPEAIGHRVAESANSIGARAREFAAEVRAGMAEREAELRDAVGLSEQ